MEKYNVTGMSCAACSARVEKAVSKLPNVTSCSVSLLTNSMGVEGDATPEEIIEAVEKAGYGASLSKGLAKVNNDANSTDNQDSEQSLADAETLALKKRLIASVAVLIPLMYESMGHMLWGWPLPGFLEGNHLGMGLYEMLLAIVIMVINRKFFTSGFKGLINGAPNMDTLVALGATAAFGYSLCALFAMSYEISKGNMAEAAAYMNEFYFESAATILTLITIGKTLEAKSKGRTTDALKSLMKLAPKTAILLRDGQEIEVPIDQVKIGDQVAIKPGQAIPVDGVVVKGTSAVNESALTGESLPVDKTIGDKVSAATINQSGYLVCEATRVGEDTTLSQIIQLMSDAAATKAPIAKLADRVSGVFVPGVMAIAAITFGAWLISGESLGFSLARGISVLVISCPCALGLATPVAIMVGSGKGAKRGILFKTALSLETAGRVQIVALDKTGTITKGEPKVRTIIPNSGIDEQQLLQLAYGLEQNSEHPLARAIVEEAELRGVSAPEVSDFKAEVGNGLLGVIGGKTVFGGNLNYISTKAELSEEDRKKAMDLALEGMTPLLFAEEGSFLGTIGVADTIKEDSAAAIEQMKKLGLQVVMITGDNQNTAEAIGKAAGVDRVIAGVLPDGKEAAIRELQKNGKVAMIGDGINDAPALARADLGVAIGAGTDVAIDAAEVVLMKSSLSDAVAAIELSRGTLRNIKENLFWAFFYNAIGIPLAAGIWIPIFGWTLSPTFGAAAMGLSSFCVVTNALRLNLIKLYGEKNQANTNCVETNPVEKKEDKEMEIKVNGMMCGHCEAHVKKALEQIDGVVEAVPSHTANNVVIKTDKDVDMAAIKAAVIDAGYEFVE